MSGGRHAAKREPHNRGRLDVRLWLIGIVADIEMGWPVFDLADDELYDRIICSG
jgi:hypothetical protein